MATDPFQRRLVSGHIEAQRRLRVLTAAAVARAWRDLGSWDRVDVPRFTDQAVPVVLASQRGSVALTNAYIAQYLGRRPLGLDATSLIGAGVRNGTPPEEVYFRPFVNVWSALKDGKPFEDAFRSGLARAEGAAATDVQLSSFHTAAAIGGADARIQRFQRAADSGACEFCQEVDGAILNSEDAAPLHSHCGCTVVPLEEDLPLTPLPDGVAVHDHGELGPVLTSPHDHFTTEAQALG
jgi:hypothetical protein